MSVNITVNTIHNSLYYQQQLTVTVIKSYYFEKRNLQYIYELMNVSYPSCQYRKILNVFLRT